MTLSNCVSSIWSPEFGYRPVLHVVMSTDSIKELNKTNDLGQHHFHPFFFFYLNYRLNSMCHTNSPGEETVLLFAVSTESQNWQCKPTQLGLGSSSGWRCQLLSLCSIYLNWLFHNMKANKCFLKLQDSLYLLKLTSGHESQWVIRAHYYAIQWLFISSLFYSYFCFINISFLF